MRPGRSCSTCIKNWKNKCEFTFTGMGACTRGRQALGQLQETHQHVIQDFIKSLKPKIKNKFANKFCRRQVQAQNSRPCIFTCTRSREENPDCRLFQGTTSWIAGLLQWLMRSSPIRLDETRAINEISSNSSYRTGNSKGNYNNKSWHQKATTSHGRTETTNTAK